jgi:hypothetical protein
MGVPWEPPLFHTERRRMSVENVKAKWVSGNLTFTNAAGATLLTVTPDELRGGVIEAAFVEAAGAATDEALVTVTLTDAAGTAVAAKTTCEVWYSDNATGAAVQTTAASGTVELDSGTIMVTYTAKKHFLVETDATGQFIISAVDTGNQAAYLAVKLPNGEVEVSGALVYEGA